MQPWQVESLEVLLQGVQPTMSLACKAAEQLLADEHKAAAQVAAKKARKLRQLTKKQQAERAKQLLQDASTHAEPRSTARCGL